MAIVRSGCKKPLNIIKKARKAQAKHTSKATSNKPTTSLPSHAAGARSLKRKHLAHEEQKLWHKQVRQDRRWLRAQVECAGWGRISLEAERQLSKRFGCKSKQEQEAPLIKEGRREELLPEAEQAWARLRMERSAAMEAAGVRNYVEDWWVGRKVQGREGDIGGLAVEMEDLEIADGEESEEGGVPIGLGHGVNEKKDEDENYEGFCGMQTVLTFRERRR